MRQWTFSVAFHMAICFEIEEALGQFHSADVCHPEDTLLALCVFQIQYLMCKAPLEAGPTGHCRPVGGCAMRKPAIKSMHLS